MFKVIVAASFALLLFSPPFARADQWSAPADWAYHQYGEGMIYVFGSCTVWASIQEDQVVASVVEGNGAGGNLQVSRISRDENGTPRLKRELPAGAETVENDGFFANCKDKLQSLPLSVQKKFAGYYGLQ